MNWRRALLILGSLGLVAFGAVQIAKLVPQTAAQRYASSSKRSEASTSVPLDTTPPSQAPAITPADMALLARIGASPTNGPGVPTDGDPWTATVPSARDLGVLATLPVDWWQAFTTATTAIEALATPVAANGTYIQSRVAPDLYNAWLKTLATKTGTGTFTVRRLHLAGRSGVGPAGINLTGTGTFTSAGHRTGYLINARVSRANGAWVLTSITFTAVGEVN